MAGFLNWFKGSKKTEDKTHFRDDVFVPGQIWHYNSRPGEEASTLTILKTERYDTACIVIHISISGIRVNSPMSPNGITEEIGHLPFAKDAVAKSVTSLVSEGNVLPDFMEGYANWKEAFDAQKGGIFGISVDEAVRCLEETILTGKQGDD